MPAPGEQHKATAVATNPFEEVKPHISEYTAQEIATLQSRLEKRLGPEYISSRPGAAGQKVHYLAAEKCIQLANEVFGFNGWSSGIQNVQVDFVDESQSTGKISLGLSVIVRVTLRDGSFHEDIGYGHIENCKGKAAAFEKAKKEGTTDALKRALRNFGNILGNCIYDKEYLAKVTKLKIAPSKWDADNLHRHADYAPVKKEPMIDADESNISLGGSCSTTKSGEDEFGGDEFDEADFGVPHEEHPDEVTLDYAATSTKFPERKDSIKNRHNNTVQRTVAQEQLPPRPPATNLQSLPGNPNTGFHTPDKKAQFNGAYPGKPPTSVQNVAGNLPKAPQVPPQQRNLPANRPQVSSLQHPQNNFQAVSGPSGPARSMNQSPIRQVQAPSNGIIHSGTSPSSSSGPIEHEPAVGFFTARVAETVQNATAIPLNVPVFNPHLESPSIRKTAGIDHTKTKPVGRDSLVAAPAVVHAAPSMKTNFVNPQTDQARRIGMPNAAGSPLQNRNSYKPPQMLKRPAEGSLAQYPRSALGDVTSASVNVPPNTDGDNKRQRIGNVQGGMMNVT